MGTSKGTWRIRGNMIVCLGLRYLLEARGNAEPEVETGIL